MCSPLRPLAVACPECRGFVGGASMALSTMLRFALFAAGMADIKKRCLRRLPCPRTEFATSFTTALGRGPVRLRLPGQSRDNKYCAVAYRVSRLSLGRTPNPLVEGRSANALRGSGRAPVHPGGAPLAGLLSSPCKTSDTRALPALRPCRPLDAICRYERPKILSGRSLHNRGR